MKGSAPPADPKNMDFEKIQKRPKVNLPKLIVFEGLCKNGYRHVFQRICFTSIALGEIDFGEFFEQLTISTLKALNML